MGRRWLGHRYVKFIILLDETGAVGQRHELDENGKLIKNVVKADRPPISVGAQKSVFLVQPPSPVKHVDRQIPIPPVMRQKMLMSGLEVNEANWELYLNAQDEFPPPLDAQVVH